MAVKALIVVDELLNAIVMAILMKRYAYVQRECGSRFNLGIVVFVACKIFYKIHCVGAINEI